MDRMDAMDGAHLGDGEGVGTGGIRPIHGLRAGIRHLRRRWGRIVHPVHQGPFCVFSRQSGALRCGCIPQRAVLLSWHFAHYWQSDSVQVPLGGRHFCAWFLWCRVRNGSASGRANFRRTRGVFSIEATGGRGSRTTDAWHLTPGRQIVYTCPLLTREHRREWWPYRIPAV